MYAYLWLCAQSVLDLTLEDPYELSRRGDVDIWQSHVVRIDFGSVPQLARAFIRFVFPDEESQFLRREQYRQLAREVTRRNASMAFELLDDSESLELIRDIWEQTPCLGRCGMRHSCWKNVGEGRAMAPTETFRFEEDVDSFGRRGPVLSSGVSEMALPEGLDQCRSAGRI